MPLVLLRYVAHVEVNLNLNQLESPISSFINGFGRTDGTYDDRLERPTLPFQTTSFDDVSRFIELCRTD